MGDFPTLGFDPAPGSAAGFGNIAANIRTAVSHLQLGQTTLAPATLPGLGWQGLGVGMFTVHVAPLPIHLGDLAGGLSAAMAKLTDYQYGLTQAKQQATQLESRAKAAQDRITALVAALTKTPGAAGVRRQLAEAEADLANAKKAARQLADDEEERAKALAQYLYAVVATTPARVAAAAGMPNELRDFKRIADGIWDAVKKNKYAIGDISDVVGDISGALALGDMVPVVGEAFGAGAEVTGDLALVGHTAAFAAGDEDAGKVIPADVIGVTTDGLSRDVGAMGKALFGRMGRKIDSDPIETITGRLLDAKTFGDAYNNDFDKYWNPTREQQRELRTQPWMEPVFAFENAYAKGHAEDVKDA